MGTRCGRKIIECFVDCILFGYHAVKGVEIATFDKKLLKLLSQEK